MNGHQDKLQSPSARNANPHTGARHVRQKAFLYGLFDATKVCVYVGQTSFPRQRKASHSCGLMRGRSFDFVILRQCKIEHAGRLEKQIIRAYWKRGQCKRNKVAGRSCAGSRSLFNLLWVEKKMVFQSFEHAAQYFNCTSSTIKNWLYGITCTGMGRTLKIIKKNS